MRRWARLPARRLSLLLWSVAFGALGFVPGFGGFTYPMGIVTGILVGVAGAAAASRCVAAAWRKGDTSASAAVLRGAGVALTLVLLTGIINVFHGLRVGFCDVGSDLLRWLLGPLAGALTAGIWGAVTGFTLPHRPRGRLLLAVGLPIGSYLFSFWRFYTSPMVFAFDHFVGYFAGTIYDTDLGSLDRLWTYRAATVAYLACGVWGVASVQSWRKGNLRHLPWRSLRDWSAALALVVGVTLSFRGPALGHYQTAASIAEQLNHEITSERCVVQFGAGVTEQSARLLSRECSAHVAELETFFAVQAPPTIRVYLFQSADQKSWFMGAKQVYVAKPWREEIYLQQAGFPHPVLRHELAHVVAGSLASGPFRVAGRWGGLLPDPGRIEGFAVAAAPEDGDPSSNLRWAAAMKRLNLLPPLGDLFQLGFFGRNSSTAYSVAGAFVQWVRERVGPQALAAWYGGESLEASTGSSWSELELGFRQRLDEVQLSDAELATARARFDRPAVLARRCPYQVDAALNRGLTLVGLGECSDARPVLAEVLSRDPSALRASLGLGQCAMAKQRYVEALWQFSSVAESPYAHGPYRAAALERQGDVAWIMGETEAARDAYARAREGLVEDERLRQLDVKETAVSANDAAREAIFTVFFGPSAQGAVPVATGARLGTWAAESGDPLAHYLLGKQYWIGGAWQLAYQHLTRSTEKPEQLPLRVVQEARRGALITACAFVWSTEPRPDGGSSMVDAAIAQLVGDSTFAESEKVGLVALARRCSAP